MNQAHLELLTIAKDLIPRALPSVELGDHLIEIGPGPGKTTDVLRYKVGRLTAVELDSVLAAGLAERLAGTNVEVVNADATQLPFQDASFSAASSFTMLHHVHTPELQNRLLAEVARVLKPGGVFFGADSLDSPEMREFHIGDVLVPVDPLTFPDRLRQAGFADVTLATTEWDLCFTARPIRLREDT